MVDSSTLELGGMELSGWRQFLFFVCAPLTGFAVILLLWRVVVGERQWGGVLSSSSSLLGREGVVKSRRQWQVASLLVLGELLLLLLL